MKGKTSVSRTGTSLPGSKRWDTGTRENPIRIFPEHETRTYRGMQVDVHIPTKALDELNGIEEIKIISTCEGEPKSPVNKNTELRFTVTNQDPNFARKLAEKLDGYANVDSYSQESSRNGWLIHVEHPDLWYGKDPRRFRRWWLSLPAKIERALAHARKE